MCRVSSRTGDLTLHSDTRWSEASGRSYMEANWQTQDQSVLSIRRNCGTLAPGCQPVSSLCVCVCDADSECVCWSVAFNDTVLADYNRHEGRSCVGKKVQWCVHCHSLCAGFEGICCPCVTCRPVNEASGSTFTLWSTWQSILVLSDVQLKTHCCCKKKSTSEKPESIKFGSYDSKLILTINLLR